MKKNYANAVSRGHGGLVFDIGNGATHAVFTPEGVKAGSVCEDVYTFEQLTYTEPTLVINEDGSLHAEPGEWRDDKGVRVRYDTDPPTVDRRELIYFSLGDDPFVTYDRNLPSGAQVRR